MFGVITAGGSLISMHTLEDDAIASSNRNPGSSVINETEAELIARIDE